MNGAESLVRTLVDSGVDLCITNPGTSEMHFVAALDKLHGMRCVLGLFEGVVTGAADGYFRMADRPAATLLHLGPGLANGLANLHNAKKARSGIVNIVGEHATYHLAHDAPLSSDVVGVARPMSDWVHTSTSSRDVARDGALAVQMARTPPGRIATLILPADTAWNEADAPAAAQAASVRPACSPDAVKSAAVALRRGARCALLLGGVGVREPALQLAGRIAARTGCALLSEFNRARLQQDPQAAARRALDELAAVNKSELGDDEQREYTEAALRVGAVRWATQAAVSATEGLHVKLRAGEPGQTCVQLTNGTQRPLAERCTYATVWAASARPSPDGRALALAVQPLEGWTELWVWRRGDEGWTLDVLPPSAAMPGLGYVEFAGWTPGPNRRLLLAREAQAEGRTTRRFEVLTLDTLSAERFASTPQLLAAFGTWADAAWRRDTVSLR